METSTDSKRKAARVPRPSENLRVSTFANLRFASTPWAGVEERTLRRTNRTFKPLWNNNRCHDVQAATKQEACGELSLWSEWKINNVTGRPTASSTTPTAASSVPICRQSIDRISTTYAGRYQVCPVVSVQGTQRSPWLRARRTSATLSEPRSFAGLAIRLHRMSVKCRQHLQRQYLS